MLYNISFHFLIYFLFLFNYEICQDIDQDTMKAVACISLIKKMDNKKLDQQLISGYMISCFINIDDANVKKILSNQFSNDIGLEKDEIKKLTDFSSFQSKYSQSEIMDFSKRLNSALEKLKDQQSMGMPPNQGTNDKSSKKISENDGGLLAFMINGLFGLFNPNDSFLFLIGFFVLVYFGLKGLKKLCVNKKKKINDKKEKRKVI